MLALRRSEELLEGCLSGDVNEKREARSRKAQTRHKSLSQPRGGLIAVVEIENRCRLDDASTFRVAL